MKKHDKRVKNQLRISSVCGSLRLYFSQRLKGLSLPHVDEYLDTCTVYTPLQLNLSKLGHVYSYLTQLLQLQGHPAKVAFGRNLSRDQLDCDYCVCHIARLVASGPKCHYAIVWREIKKLYDLMTTKLDFLAIASLRPSNTRYVSTVFNLTENRWLEK